MKDLLTVFMNGEECDPENFSYASELVFIDAGARAGELFPNEEGPGVYFEIDKERECLKVRSDLGSHVKYAFIPFRFELNQIYYQNAEFHLFEPNPEFINDLKEKARYASRFNCIVWVHQTAIGDKLEKTKFKLTPGGWGSTFCQDKQNENFIDEIEVQKIDFLSFLSSIHHSGIREKENISVHIKMDVEGAEYEVLPRMFANWNQHCYGVKSLSVEFHRDFYLEKHDKWIANYYFFLISLIKSGVKFNWWPGEW